MTTHLKYFAQAIDNLCPDASFAIANTYESLEWGENNVQSAPTKEEIFQEIDRILLVEKFVNERKAAYPSIEDQLDMQYWDSVNGTTTWQDTINAIKNQYPKPEEI